MDTTVLFPTNLLGYGDIFDPDYMSALCRAYNSYVADEWLAASPRLRAVSLMPLLQVDESIREMKRTITELGFSGVTVPRARLWRPRGQNVRPFLRRSPELGLPGCRPR